MTPCVADSNRYRKRSNWRSKPTIWRKETSLPLSIWYTELLQLEVEKDHEKWTSSIAENDQSWNAETDHSLCRQTTGYPAYHPDVKAQLVANRIPWRSIEAGPRLVHPAARSFSLFPRGFLIQDGCNDPERTALHQGQMVPFHNCVALWEYVGARFKRWSISISKYKHKRSRRKHAVAGRLMSSLRLLLLLKLVINEFKLAQANDSHDTKPSFFLLSSFRFIVIANGIDYYYFQ